MANPRAILPRHILPYDERMPRVALSIFYVIL